MWPGGILFLLTPVVMFMTCITEGSGTVYLLSVRYFIVLTSGYIIGFLLTLVSIYTETKKKRNKSVSKTICEGSREMRYNVCVAEKWKSNK